ncbi:hypothetical protein DKX38_001500 [Salix brachista]|uniref:Uncharacterized protein n=1 Tax=Salix brachista TaxID=2182728 RepID=A0A5N5P6A8_9ROSI|nr:hypothetical protein DKX38_001500 [Salix brachista]
MTSSLKSVVRGAYGKAKRWMTYPPKRLKHFVSLFIELEHLWVLLHQVLHDRDPQGRDVESFHRHLYSSGNLGSTSEEKCGSGAG